jgi:hypothetical protein
MPLPTDTSQNPGCEHVGVGSRGSAIKFRHSTAITAAAVIALLGATPMLLLGWYAVPIMAVPALVAIWGWRSGTDADADGVRVRALIGSRLVPWSQVAEVAAAPKGRAAARLVNGAVLALPAVPAKELSRLVSASGQETLIETP